MSYLNQSTDSSMGRNFAESTCNYFENGISVNISL